MKLYLVGHWFMNGKIDGLWEVCGIYDNEELAVNACKDGSYFVGPIDLNKTVPKKTITWPGSYYPKAYTKDKKGIN